MRSVFAFIQALLPLSLFTFMAIVSYAKVLEPWNYFLAFLFILVGLFAAKSVFQMIVRRGYFEVMAGNDASPDMDDLEPSPIEGVYRRQPEELEQLFAEQKLEFAKGTITIWGDWEGRHLEEVHTLSSVKFTEETEILTLTFTNGNLLKIKRPQVILEASTYFKVSKAKEVMWQISHESRVNLKYSYLHTGKDIVTKSNTNWKPHKYDIGIGKNALYLQG